MFLHSYSLLKPTFYLKSLHSTKTVQNISSQNFAKKTHSLPDYTFACEIPYCHFAQCHLTLHMPPNVPETSRPNNSLSNNANTNLLS